MRSLFLFLILSFALLFNSISASSRELSIVIPKLEDSPELHLYFHHLLKKALIQDGHTPAFNIVNLPQSRAKRYLENGEITIFWMLESEERNRKFVQIDVPLTDGLIGKRILFIKKGTQSNYDDIRSLEDMQQSGFVGLMGEGWIDARVWKINNLKCKEVQGNWDKIFDMVAYGRGHTYFSRGLNEILVEAKDKPELDIEENLVFEYQRDFYYYLSRKGQHAGVQYKDIITRALKRAKESGLILSLVQRYWGSDFKKLHYKERIKIPLISGE